MVQTNFPNRFRSTNARLRKLNYGASNKEKKPSQFVGCGADGGTDFTVEMLNSRIETEHFQRTISSAVTKSCHKLNDPEETKRTEPG